MTYLDYSTTSPISLDALDAYNKTAKEYFGSVYASNAFGEEAKRLLDNTTHEISNMFHIMDSEIIYTSGASEANNMALIEISYVSNDEEGLILFDDLKNLIRPDTILVSISAVNYETGVRQPLKMLRQIIKKENDQTLFHSDLSQAIGKMSVSFRDIDLGSVSAHKFYGPKGIGFLYKNSGVTLTPLMYGAKKSGDKPGMPALPLIVSMKEALKVAIRDLEKRDKYITLLNERVVSKLAKLEGIKINTTKYSIPHIINISLFGVSALSLSNALSNHEIYVSVNNPNEICSGVMAIYNDLERSKSCMRISLSHLTTVLEINRFLEVFEVEYNRLKI